MRPICLDHLSLYDVTALELIDIAAALGCAKVSLFVTGVMFGPALDLTTHPAALRAVRNALKRNGLGVGLIEPFMLGPEIDWAEQARIVAVAAELCGLVNALGFDETHARLTDSFGRLHALCKAAGAEMVTEAYPGCALKTQAQAMAMAQSVSSEIGLVVDVLHVHRSGGTWADVAALPPALIRHMQVCDAPLAPPQDLFNEALYARLPPGHGDFALTDLIKLAPARANLAVEAPFVAPPGMKPFDRARIVVEGLRGLLR